MKYTGPPKPISLDPMRHTPWQRIERVIFLLAYIAAIAVLIIDMTYWRPG